MIGHWLLRNEKLQGLFTRRQFGLSLRSRRLEVVGERENGRARGRHARVSPSRTRVFSCAHYFQAPATQANLDSRAIPSSSLQRKSEDEALRC